MPARAYLVVLELLFLSYRFLYVDGSARVGRRRGVGAIIKCGGRCTKHRDNITEILAQVCGDISRPRGLEGYFVVYPVRSFLLGFVIPRK